MRFKTTPYAHQLAAFERSCEREYFALTMEQGTGKTKVIIDTAAYLFERGRIDALLVIAPNGVHRSWVTKEIPKHLPDHISRACSAWQSVQTKQVRAAHDAMLQAPPPCLHVLTLNVEALSVERVVKEVKLFLDAFRALVVIDECTRIKNPQSARTKTVLSLRHRAPYRRILSGTPVPNSPLDVFAPYSFLDPDIFPTHSYTVFRARYSELLPSDDRLIQHIMRTTGKRYVPQIVATDASGRPIYKNLDELRSLTEPHTLRVLKRDCLDLPPKLYVRRAVDLSASQRKVYEALCQRLRRGIAEGETVGKTLTKLNAVMYLQRVLLGMLPAPMSESGENVRLHEPKDNPRIRALLEELEESAEQAIIWCAFTDDIEAITQMLRATYGDASTVQYYGATSAKDRDEAVARFAAGSARFFVGNSQAGGTGLDGLQVAREVHYYSNSFKLETRLQSEDRAHRIGQQGTVRYVDYEVEGTVDTKILQAYLDKKDVADAITGDKFEEWLQ